jgi:phosphohistidine phosphatase
MKIYLVRHGLANSAEVDPEKGLSDQGKAEIVHLAEAVRHLGISVKEIWHSGKARAEQTAQILAQAIKSERGVVQKDGLGPTDPVQDVAVKLKAAGEDIMLVGHLPFMAKLESFILAGDDHHSVLEFKAGSVACLEHTKGKCLILWFINPEISPTDQAGQFRSYH